MFSWIETKIINWPPASRRRASVHVLFWSVVAAFVNVTLFVTGVIDESGLILITLVLSWLAITITAADLIATTDVREETTDTKENTEDIEEDTSDIRESLNKED